MPIVKKTLKNLYRGKVTYNEYIDGKNWKMFRVKNIDNMCACCGSNKLLQLHHVTYMCGLNNPNYVVTLCKKCHQAVHDTAKARKINVTDATAKVMSKHGVSLLDYLNKPSRT